MTKLVKSLIIMVIVGHAGVVQAHGLVDDGHITVLDYIQVIGIGVISLGLLAYSFDQWRKDRKKRQK